MTRWAAFAGVAAFVLIALLALARLSQSALSPRPRAWPDPHLPDGAGHLDALDLPTPSEPEFGPVALLVNVALSQGMLAVLLVGAAWYFAVPPAALGLRLSVPLAAVGIGLGLGLFLADEAATAVASALDVHPGAELRDWLSPESALGWVVLLGGVLPVVAGFEELLFRGVLVGALSAGFGVSPWLLAVLSSVAFAAGHGAQGLAGIVVTGLLGFALAAAFVLTGSLLVVVLAHYLVNALEFVVHERAG